jgi:hypothetical protein
MEPELTDEEQELQADVDKAITEICKKQSED